MFNKRLTKSYLEKLYNRYNRLDSADDPIQIVRLSQGDDDKEILAFISSLYAFGNIKQINSILNKIFQLLRPSPKSRILDRDYIFDLKEKVNINHRFLFHSEFIKILMTLHLIFNKHQNLKSLFLMGYNPEERNLKSAISNFSKRMREFYTESQLIVDSKNIKSKGFLNENKSYEQRIMKFLFPDPATNSTCKRMNLFLRWMVRKDNVDLGLWHEIKSYQLVIPLDTHIYQVARLCNLTQKKSPSWNMAVEITESLKKFDPLDPIKYDFALSHIKL